MFCFRGGTFGELRVYYNTLVLAAIAETPDSINNVMEYFSQPQLGSRGIPGELVEVPQGSDPTRVGLMNGWMTCDFTSFSTVFQLNQDNGGMIMKDCVQ